MRGIVSSFRIVIVVSGALALADIAGAQSQSITGRVVGTGGTPVTGVRVSLPRLGLSFTTGADGKFELKVPNTSIIPGISPRDPRLTLRENGVEFQGGRDVLGKSMQGATAHNRVMVLEGRIKGASEADASSHRARALPRASAAAAADTMSFTKTGWFTKKTEMATTTEQNMGDVNMDRNIVGVGNTINDKYDQHIVDAYKKNGMDSSMAMIVKAMIVIESSFNANAISMYDVQLPCGTHSYGLIQVTPGCVKGYATLPAGTKVTASVSGGLNGNKAVVTWFDPADQASGNTVVQENGIIINIVTNPANPFWPTSAFNPAYSIDNGAKTVWNIVGEMKRKFAGCSAANYVQMALAGYNQGSGTVSGCTAYTANGNAYQQKVIDQYRKFSTSAGVTPVY